MSLNRTSCNDGEGVGKHIGESLSFPKHEFRMRKQKGDSYEYHELWDSLHILHEDGPNKGQFIDQKAKKTHEKSDEIFQQQHLEISSSSSCNVNEKVIFVEAAGDMKKDHVHGLGSESKCLKSIVRTSSSSQSSQVESQIIEVLKKEIDDLKQQVASRNAQILDLKRGQEKILKSLEKMKRWTIRPIKRDGTSDS